jgi:hypothetical protein
MKSKKAKTLIGCCGLYCGLCSKYQSNAPSRCIGCKLGEQHSWCSILNCCSKKHKYETCAECPDIFKCVIFLRRKVNEWVPATNNLNQIKKAGLNKWLKEQKERQASLEELLWGYNDGRSMSFYCRVCSNMPIECIKEAIKGTQKKIERENANKSDIKSKANIMKTLINDIAVKYKFGVVWKTNFM